MRSSTPARLTLALVTVTAALVLSRTGSEAHTPITSPYTYNEHVFPILRAHCGRCHVPGGVGPMSLMTHADAVPWAESIRVELMAGHMPPWPADAARGRFRHTQGLSAKELDVVLTWASGGAPIGLAPDPAPVAAATTWPLGPPDAEIALPAFRLDERTGEATGVFTVAAGTTRERWLRVVDVRPGTPSVVRAAAIALEPSSERLASDGTSAEHTLGVWLPGDTPQPFPAGTAVRLPAGAPLVVRIRYKKTWAYEGQAMEDRSTLGLYFAEEPSAAVRALRLVPTPGAASTDAPELLTFSVDLASDVRVLAVYPDAGLTGLRTTADAVRKDGSRVALLALGPQGGWARRYWFTDPVTLERGTRLVVRTQVDQDSGVLAGGQGRSARAVDPAAVGLTLNVVSASR
jgi:hypothetical protein